VRNMILSFVYHYICPSLNEHFVTKNIQRLFLSSGDAAEKQIKDVEKQLNVKVQRIRVGRYELGPDQAGEELFKMISAQMNQPPFLYHRESRQVIKCVPDLKGDTKIQLSKKYMVDWALGRKLPQKGSYGTARKKGEYGLE